ncbi:MAG: hypothetical protein ACTSQJ_02960 [Promethearchaeota archaeon]
MTFINSYRFARKYQGSRNVKRKILCLLLLLIFFFNFILLRNSILFNNSNFVKESKDDQLINRKNDLPDSSVNFSILQDPFTKNFDKMGEFFIKKYKSDLDLNVSTFFRYGDAEGNVSSDEIFSMDNLLLYKTLLQPKTSSILTYSIYRELKNTILWYEGNVSLYKYGFINSINGTTEKIKENKRYLTDNLMPIFLLIENLGDDLNVITVGGASPKDDIKEIFLLINSSEFWDNTNSGFFNYNSSSEDKYVESNFYGVLACYLIKKTTGLESNIKGRAFELANETMTTLLKKMWDKDEYGFFYSASSDWDTAGGIRRDKFLNVNALGITTLIEHWLMTGKNCSEYIDNATLLFNLLSYGPNKLWNSTYNAYEYHRNRDWTPTINKNHRALDLEANALMMIACLRLFDATGNISYYNRALELNQFFETYLFDNSINGYNSSLNGYASNDDTKNFYKNLRLCEAYLKGYEIYNASVLSTEYNVTQDIPEYIINQDFIKLTSNYKFERKNTYYLPKNGTFQDYKVKMNLTNADITYIFRYPNETVFHTEKGFIKPNKTIGHKAEITKIICTNDTNNDLNNTYFLLDTPSTKYYVWININNSSTPDPSIAGRIGIEIKNITINATKEQVASNISKILQNYNNGSVFTVSLKKENITITNIEHGIANNAADGTNPFSTNFTFQIIQEGTNISVVTHTLLYKIPENLPLSSKFGLDEDFTILVYANTTNFGFAYDVKKFRVISGLDNKSLLIPSTTFYQGQTINITLSVESVRSKNFTLNVSVESEGIINVHKFVNISANQETLIKFNITSNIYINPGTFRLKFYFKNGTIIYLKVIKAIEISNALEYSHLIYNNKIVSGDDILVSLNLINHLPNNSQILNISFTGNNILNIKNEVVLNSKEIKIVSYNIQITDNIVDDTIQIEMAITKKTTIFYTKTIFIEILPEFEIISTSFPETIAQGETAYFILMVQNNRETSEEFSIYLNGEKVDTNIDELGPGENRIVVEIIPTINPYEFGKKSFTFVLKDSSDDTISQFYFEVEIKLSMFNFIFAYFLPIIIPIGIILFFKNKDIKHKLLKK